MMDAGRDLDVAIAQRVLGLMVLLEPDEAEHKVISPKRREVAPLPCYSTVTEHAYLLVNWLQAQGFYCHIRSSHVDQEIRFTATLFRVGRPQYEAVATTLPHAICLAALELFRPDED